MFPDCDFKFSVSEPALYLGRRISGQLEVTAKKDIARAEVAFITYMVDASAEWGEGENRTIVRRQLCRMVVRHDLPAGGLTAGAHVFGFLIRCRTRSSSTSRRTFPGRSTRPCASSCLSFRTARSSTAVASSCPSARRACGCPRGSWLNGWACWRGARPSSSRARSAPCGYACSTRRSARGWASGRISPLAALPFAGWTTPAHVDAWRAAAVEARAFLVPSVPKLSRIPVSARLFGGVDVTIFATLGTSYESAGPGTIVEVDLSATPLPPNLDQASTVGDSGTIMTSIRAVFPVVEVSGTRAKLSRPGAAEDPRPLLPALGELLSWVIEVRGLRREAAAPYR